ncbi:MAG: hypothetical protein QOF37_2678, partial [Thermoleophilaceae bacterium]|nr:hypothetical protein [Thermoleophilaceae bacterium]
NGSDLRAGERAIIASALEGAPATLLKSETMDWHRRVATIVDAIVGPNANPSSNGHAPRNGGIRLAGGQPAVATETAE